MGENNSIFDIEEPELVLKRDHGIPIVDGQIEVIPGKGMPIVVDHDEEEKYGIYSLNIK